MGQPKFPTADELKRAAAYSPEAAQALIDEYIRSLEEHNRTSIAERREAVNRSRDARRYQAAALVAGLCLSAASLIFCGYAVEQHADIGQVAAVLGAVGGVASIFLLGAQSAGRRTPIVSRDRRPQYPDRDGSN